MYIVCFCLIFLSVFLAERSSLIKGQIDISDTIDLLYIVKITSEHRSEIRVSDICNDPNS